MCAPAPPAPPPPCGVDVVVTPLPHTLPDTAAPAAVLATFPIPWPNAGPHHVAVAPDGAVWFSDMWHDCVGRLEPQTGRLAGIALPAAGTQPHGLAIAPDGAIWYASPGRGVIGSIDPATHLVREHALADAAIAPHSLVVHRDLVWFTGRAAGRYGVLDPATGVAELHALPLADAVPYELAAAPDGGVWITLSGVGALVRVDPDTRAARLVPLPADASPSGVTVAEDGRVWYTDEARSRLAVLTAADSVGDDAGPRDSAAPAWTLREYATTQPRAHPRSPALSPDGQIWYFEEAPAHLVAADEGGGSRVLVLPELPAPGRVVRSIAVDAPRGALWIAPGGGGALVRIDLRPAR